MAKKQTTKKGSSTAGKVGVGVGLTAAAVAAAGAYFLYGSPNAAKNRKKVKSWTLHAKAEVLDALDAAKEMTEEEYADLVAAVAGAYGSAKKVSKRELNDFTKEMQDHWKKIEKTAPARHISQKAKKVGASVMKKAKSVGKKKTKKSAKRTTKKTTKKAANKTTKPASPAGRKAGKKK